MGARMRHSGPSVSGESGAVVFGKNAPGIVPFAENTPMKRFAGFATAPKLVAGRQMGDVSATVRPLRPPKRRRRENFVRLSLVRLSLVRLSSLRLSRLLSCSPRAGGGR